VIGGRNGVESQISLSKDAIGELIAAKLSGKEAASTVTGLSGLDQVHLDGCGQGSLRTGVEESVDPFHMHCNGGFS